MGLHVSNKFLFERLSAPLLAVASRGLTELTIFPLQRQERRVPGDMVEVLAEKVVAAGQSLLRMVAELKRRALLADAAAVNSAVDERSERYGQAAGATEGALRALRDEVSSTVQACSWRFENSKGCLWRHALLWQPGRELCGSTRPGAASF